MTGQLDAFFIDFPNFSPDDQKRIRDAWVFMEEHKKGIAREGGEAYMDHPLRVARILAFLNLDPDSIISAFLHGPSESPDFTGEAIEKKFGKSVVQMVEGASRISALKLQNKSVQQAESIRKMFFAMVDDIRIILLRLADRLDKMRNLRNFPANTQKIIAQETIDIWAPLANRLGISYIKDELEDLALKYINPDVYEQIKNLVAAKKGERADFLEHAEKEIYKTAHRSGIEITVHSRAKHFWSIYQKMKKRNKAADEMFDLLAMRLLCDSVNECYTLLGLVHTIWKPLDGRFKDYIAMPKANGYQSLHTTVICLEGRPLEIQIRTRDMHNIAENGIASHWIYKKGTTRDSIKADHLSIIKGLKELSQNRFTDEDFLAQIKSDLLGDSIFVFTPKGDIIELPSGATAIDFAYTIHSAVGEKIVGAKADGQIIQLSQSLKNTQVVEILTHPQAHPTQNQYNSVHTAKARQKIRAWLHANDPGATSDKKDSSETDKTADQGSQIRAHHKSPQQEEQADTEEREFDTAVLKIRIGDTTNFMIKFANCCKPVPPVPIIGYVSRGRGIIIHQTGCTNLARIPDIKNRIINVEWELPPEAAGKKKKT